MRIVIGSDHAGFPLKAVVVDAVREAGHEPVDLGTFTTDSVDYPDYAALIAGEILAGKADRGIAICGSGVGVCIAANKIPGIYAALCHDSYTAHQGVEHDGMNVLCLGGRVIGPELARDIVKSYLQASQMLDPRFLKRIDKVKALEAKYSKG